MSLEKIEIENSKDSKYQLGSNYSISKDLKQDVIDETTTGSQPEHLDVLQKRIQERSIYNREDNYHKQRLRKLDDEKGDKQLRLASFKTKDVSGVATVKRLKGESRWDVQTYELPVNNGEPNDANSENQQQLLQGVAINVPYENDLKYFKPSDKLHFAKLIEDENANSDSSSPETKNERNLLLLLLKIKNGNSVVRKVAMKKLTSKCIEFGPKLIFDSILPILLDRSLEDRERQLMIKVVDRILYRLGDSVKSYTRNILTVVSPLLIDEDPVARIIGREVISNLASITGVGHMLTTMKADLDSEDEYIRNITSKALAVVAKALSLPKVLPYIHAMCHSQKSWRARHTGVKIIQQIAILMGMDILRHLIPLIRCLKDSLYDEHISIRILTANTISILAEKCNPYGIEVFNIILEDIWKGVLSHRGKLLTAFMKCIGSLIPLMDPEYSGYYSSELIKIISREMSSPDDEMKKTVLLVLQKCIKLENITGELLLNDIGPSFYKNFWIRRISLDKQLNKMTVYTTVILSEKLGCKYTVENLLDPLRDEAVSFRSMAIHAINRTVKLLGTAELDDRLETRLIDALLIAFQDQDTEDSLIFNGFGTVARSLDTRMKPFLAPIVSTILNQLKHKNQIIRQNAADLCNIIIPVIKNCEETDMLNKLSIILYESLGEVYPEVLGSIIKCISTVIEVSTLSNLQPPVNQIMPTLTPILRNKHIKVQTYLIKLISTVAIRGASYVAPKEWVRICFELLESLKSPNKNILRATNDTFGYIAKAIGPQDVLVVLLNNLKVQERQSRVSTAVAIGKVAETCGPYTVLPALMNEYKTPETNIQNGILKAMTFMFEYIGPMSQDYIYMITPMIEDALIDRDLVHRQTASTIIKHLALHCCGSGNEDAFIHMLNLLIPNILETSPHVIARIIEGLECLCYAVGPGIFLNYIWAGLFHPSKNVRSAYWKVYNKVYIQYVDAIVPYYPVSTNEYQVIEELDYVL
ncbi:U2 snRNP complex subunit HSH155 PWA37_001194 [Arxiozyma heterogenica]|uniref:U2 snRNP complex subunit HSH155 n=1 Tax=Arxiozyma heterogenica TaxID=278026 RepID=UPI002F1A9B58